MSSEINLSAYRYRATATLKSWEECQIVSRFWNIPIRCCIKTWFLLKAFLWLSLSLFRFLGWIAIRQVAYLVNSLFSLLNEYSCRSSFSSIHSPCNDSWMCILENLELRQHFICARFHSARLQTYNITQFLIIYLLYFSNVYFSLERKIRNKRKSVGGYISFFTLLTHALSLFHQFFSPSLKM